MNEKLEKLVCISLDVRIWSGRKKLSADDLNLQPGAVPPQELASLGSKKVCDPQRLRVFHTLKRRAERVCATCGVRFLGGYAVPQDKAEEVLTALRELSSCFETDKADFLRHYEQTLEQWLETLSPQWRAMVRSATEPLSQIGRRLTFGHQCYRVEAVGGMDGGLDATVASLGELLLQEIAAAAARVWEESFRGRETVTQKALRPVRAILEKARGLVFLDGRIAPVVERIEAGLAALPQSGPIAGQDFHALIGLLHQLADLGEAVNPVEVPPEPPQDEETLFGPSGSAEAPETQAAETYPSVWF